MVSIGTRRLFRRLSGLPLHEQHEAAHCPFSSADGQMPSSDQCIRCASSAWAGKTNGAVRLFAGKCGAANGVVFVRAKGQSVTLVVQDRHPARGRLPATTVDLLKLVREMLMEGASSEKRFRVKDGGRALGMGDSRLVRSMIEYAQQHFRHPMSLADVAETLRRNPNYLAHMFAVAMNMPFHQYLEDLRMNEAERLLRNGVLTVGEVAAGVGFSSADYFRQAFKRRTGASPLQWSEHQSVQGNVQPSL